MDTWQTAVAIFLMVIIGLIGYVFLQLIEESKEDEREKLREVGAEIRENEIYSQYNVLTDEELQQLLHEDRVQQEKQRIAALIADDRPAWKPKEYSTVVNKQTRARKYGVKNI